MTRLILNADDLGYSEAVTLGIIKAHKDGIIISTTLMSNMPAAKMAADLVKKYPGLYVGQHTNILVGKPCEDPKKIPSLVDKNGCFNVKERLKNGMPLPKEEIKMETKAQARKFKELMGYYPPHIEVHSLLLNSTVLKAIAEVARELGVHFTDAFYGIRNDRMVISKKNIYNYGYEIPDIPNVAYMDKTVELDYWIHDKGEILKKDLVEMHTHPGYIDQDLLNLSSYNIPRAKELSIVCSKEMKKWIKDNDVKLITFEDIKNMNRN